MSAIENAFYDLGKGLGYIYVTGVSNTSPTVNDIVKVLDNDAEGLREAKIYGLKAAALASNRVGTAIYTINAPTGVGSITNIKVGAVELIDPAVNIAYTGATTANDLAQDIVDAINNYTTGTASENYTAARIANTLYVFTNPEAGSSANKSPITFTATGFFTTTEVQAIQGGSSNTKPYDDGFGYRFFVDADYDANGCAGAGTATVDNLTNAIEVTNYLVFVGLQSGMPLISSTLADDSIVKDRKGSMSVLSLTGEGSLDDDLNTIILKNMEIGDRIVLVSTTNTITLNDYTVASGNVKLKTTDYGINGTSTIELIYNLDGYWYEISRSTQVIGSIADYRTAGFGMFGIETASTQAVGTGGAVVFDPNSDSKLQILTGTSTLVSSQSYDATGTVEDGDEFWIRVDAQVDVAAHALQIYGRIIPSDLAAQGGYMVYSRYMGAISRWQTHVYPLLDDGAMSYPFQVYSGMISTGAVTAAKVETTLKTEVLSRQISFESNEVGDMKMYMGYPGTVEYLWFVVDKDLAATDDGTIVPKNNAGTAMTSGTVTATASSAIATSFTSTPTANNTFVAGDVLTFTTAKTTKGGKGTLYVKVSKS